MALLHVSSRFHLTFDPRIKVFVKTICHTVWLTDIGRKDIRNIKKCCNTMLHWSVTLSFERVLSMASFVNGHEAQQLAQPTGND